MALDYFYNWILYCRTLVWGFFFKKEEGEHDFWLNAAFNKLDYFPITASYFESTKPAAASEKKLSKVDKVM